MSQSSPIKNSLKKEDGSRRAAEQDTAQGTRSNQAPAKGQQHARQSYKILSTNEI